MKRTPTLIICGPTASGKTALAVAVARTLNGEIISADSRQIYRGMDLGTGKDLYEYGDVPYHLIDIVPAGYKYNLYEYLRDFQIAYESVCSRGRIPVICGGTGLYIESIAKGIRLPEVPQNPELRAKLANKSLDELGRILASMKTLHNTTDIDSCKRAIRAIEIEDYYLSHPDAARQAQPSPLADTVIIGVDVDREIRRRRITSRLKARLDAGMVDEVKLLLQSGVAADDLIYYGLEYKYLTLYLIGRLSYEEMFKRLEIAIHQFAKRQMTWFRGMERRGFKINWIPFDMPHVEAVEYVKQLVEDEAHV